MNHSITIRQKTMEVSVKYTSQTESSGSLNEPLYHQQTEEAEVSMKHTSQTESSGILDEPLITRQTIMGVWINHSPQNGKQWESGRITYHQKEDDGSLDEPVTTK